METRVKEKNCQKIVDRYFRDWNFTNNYSHAINGRVWVFWRDLDDVKVVAATDQSITLSFKLNTVVVYISVIYAANDGVVRRELWSHLVQLHGSIQGRPWFMLGDFNVLLKSVDCSRFSEFRQPSAEMKEFAECLEVIGMFDHPFVGPAFTWKNNQESTFQPRKLDRAMVNGLRWKLSLL